MPTVELNDRFCASVKPSPGKQVDYFDSIVRGLSLLVSPAGTKTFFLNFTRPGGKRARLKIGRYPDIKLARARERAREGRGDLSEGIDPIAERRAAAAAQTVADLVENYLRRHAATKRSHDEIARRLRKNVSGLAVDGKPVENASGGCIGAVKLSELHRRDITRAIDAVKDRGAGVEANRLFEDLRAMVRWARARGDLDANLTEGMRRPTQTVERDRVLSADEIRTMWRALSDADMRESTRRVIRLCLVTGQRVGEVAGMTRDELDLDRALWTIPGGRSKNGREHVVPLSDMAATLIREQLADVVALSERKGRGVPTFVFPGPGARNAVTGAAIAKAIKRLEVIERGAVIILGVSPGWTCHDLRRSCATHMEEMGVSPFTIGHILNHVSATKSSITSRVYARHSYLPEKTEALSLWGTRLAAIIGDAPAAEIVPLHRGRASR